MIGRNNIAFLFIVEARPDDSARTIHTALVRRPFNQSLFIDYSNSLLKDNPWLEKRKYKGLDGFLISKDNKIISIGNPQDSFNYLLSLKSVTYE